MVVLLVFIAFVVGSAVGSLIGVSTTIHLGFSAGLFTSALLVFLALVYGQIEGLKKR